MDIFTLKRLREMEEQSKEKEIKTEKQEEPGRHFHFMKEATYIEKQEIIVQAGANFYNGPAQHEEEPHPLTHTPDTLNSVMTSSSEGEVPKDTNKDPETPIMTTPHEWCMAGIREVVRAGHLEYGYDWAAVLRVIQEKTPYQNITPNDLVTLVTESGVTLEPELQPVADNFRRISIQGKFPEWTVKGYDATNRFQNLGRDFLTGYQAAKKG